MGAALQNLGGLFGGARAGRTPLLVAKMGAGYQAASWLLTAADLDVRRDGRLRLHAGAEIQALVMRFRAGLRRQPTLGFGLAGTAFKTTVRFDYAFEIDPKGLDDLSRFGFSLSPFSC